MSTPFHIQVFDRSAGTETRLLFKSDVNQPFRIGRQEAGEPASVNFFKTDPHTTGYTLKLVVGSANETKYSRRFAEVALRKEKFEVKNTSANQTIFCSSAAPIGPQESRLFSVPFEITLGYRTIAFTLNANSDCDVDCIQSLPTPAKPPNLGLQRSSNAINWTSASQGQNIDRQRLMELLQAMLQIFQGTPGRQEFFDQTAIAIFQLFQFEHVLIALASDYAPDLRPKLDARNFGNRWRTQSFHSAQKDSSRWQPSSRVLETVRESKTTVYTVPDREASLMEINCLVASPLLNADNEVIGIIYGDREMMGSGLVPIGETEAMFVELFANGISVGLERMNHERQISEMRARFDQFFTPDLARLLESNPKSLEPKSAQVSVLFADIRGFSRIAERIGPRKTIKWINSVLSQLSDCVFENDGVVVDYIGDEIMAMWGAPIERENHAELAVLAALDMIALLPSINEQWAEVIGEPFDLGIGINTGDAQVGNTGSARKFKYGPLGDVVNVGSRLQGATKQIQARLLVTESTSTALPREILSRKIRSVRFVNVERAVAVYEIPCCPDSDWIELKQEYETGLEFFEAGKLALASQKMASVINKFPGDGPSMLLLSDAVRWLQLGSSGFDPVWQLPQK